jgi:hypothetical protein
MAKKPLKKAAKKAAPASKKKAASKPAPKKAAKKVVKKAVPVKKKAAKKVIAKKVAKKVVKKITKALPPSKVQKALPAPKSTSSSKAVPTGKILKPVVKGKIPEAKKAAVASVVHSIKAPSLDADNWSKMSDEQKRIFMTNTSIKFLERGLGVATGDYIHSKSLERSLTKIGQKTDFKHMLENASDVTVCGAGILLYADIITRGDYMVYPDNKLYNIGLSDISNRLNYFNEEQLKLIETAFETKWAFTGSESKGMPAIIFGQKFTDVRRRLAAILKNMSDNHGTFRP